MWAESAAGLELLKKPPQAGLGRRLEEAEGTGQETRPGIKGHQKWSPGMSALWRAGRPLISVGSCLWIPCSAFWFKIDRGSWEGGSISPMGICFILN